MTGKEIKACPDRQLFALNLESVDMSVIDLDISTPGKPKMSPAQIELIPVTLEFLSYLFGSKLGIAIPGAGSLVSKLPVRQ